MMMKMMMSKMVLRVILIQMRMIMMIVRRGKEKGSKRRKIVYIGRDS